ncbi:MAG: DUF1611 domain-containing protein [Chitinophagaceae bacterium]|jgi:uncharacterized NAD-dependent epimerase/dehydratase family protein|nr:MAG: DUF1611 domain-containing protein [Chitinophagaceae bacterium]
MNNAIILTNGLLTTSDAKTAHGLIRGTEKFTIVGVIDGIETAGNDAGNMLDGKHRNIPVFSSLEEAMENINKVDFLIIGVATVGGKLPGNMLEVVRKAIQKGISIVNGLHEYLNDKEDIVLLAQEKGAQLIDIRQPKKREQLHFWSGEIFKIKTPVVAVLGMDCAMGKRTTARLLKQACEKISFKAEMIFTGQTGWLQGGKYGFIFDSTLNDFVSGELENAIVTCAKEAQPDIIFLEGQSSLRNPSGPCGIELLISGNAKHVVLIFAPKRKYFDNEAHWGFIPSVASEIEIIEKLGSKVIGVAINTENCTTQEAFEFQAMYSQQLNIPVLLPLEEGVDPLLPILQQLIHQQ